MTGATALCLYLTWAGLPGPGLTGADAAAPPTRALHAVTVAAGDPGPGGCPNYQICLYPQPNYGGKALITGEPDPGGPGDGKCVRFTARSIVHNGILQSGDSAGRNYVYEFRVFDNPNCNGKAPHHSKVVLSGDTEPHLSVGGPTGTVRSFTASSREVKPRNGH
jgi:hypothetical protein